MAKGICPQVSLTVPFDITYAERVFPGDTYSHPPNGDRGNTGADRAVAGAVFTARRLLVGVVVEDGVADTSDGGQG